MGDREVLARFHDWRTARNRGDTTRFLLVFPPHRANGGACIAWGGAPFDVRHVIFALGGAF